MSGEPRGPARGAGRRRPEDRRRRAPTTAAPSAPGIDYAQAQRQPGSSMKPYVLATALEQGIGVDGPAGRQLAADVPGPRDRRCATPAAPPARACTLKEAMTRSLNTTFYGLAYEVGPENVARDRAARRPGMPDVWEGGAGSRARRRWPTPRRRHRLGDRHRRVRDAPDRPGRRLRHLRQRRHPARPVLRREGRPTARAPCCWRTRGDPGEQVMRAGRRQRRHLRDQGRRRLLQAGRWTTAGRWPARPAPQGLDRRGQLRRLDGRVHARRSRRRSGWAPTGPRARSSNAGGRIIYGSGLPGAIWQQFMNTVLDGHARGGPARQGRYRGRHRRGRRRSPTTEAPPPTSAARADPDDGDAARTDARRPEPDARRPDARATTTPTATRRPGTDERRPPSPAEDGTPDAGNRRRRIPAAAAAAAPDRTVTAATRHTEAVTQPPRRRHVHGPLRHAAGGVRAVGARPRAVPARARTASSRAGPTRSSRRPARRSAGPGAGTPSPAGRSSGRRCGSACCSPRSCWRWPGSSRRRARPATGAGSMQYTHFCYSDTVPLFGLHGLDTGDAALPRLRGRVPGADRRLHGARRGPGPGLRRRRPRRSGLLPDLPPVQSYYVVTCLLLSVCALLLTRGRAGAGRPPALGRRDGRALPAAARARVHQLGPVRGRPGHPRHVGLGAATGRCWPACCSGSGSRRSSTRCCCWARCSCCACGPGGCASGLRTAVAAVAAWAAVNLPVAVARAGELGLVLRASTAAGRPTRTRSGTCCCTPPTSGCFDGPLAAGEIAAVLNAVVAVGAAAAGRRRRLADPGRPGAAPRGAGGVPAGRRLPAAQQGLEPAVLAVAAAPGGAGPAAVALAAALAGHRGAAVGRRGCSVPRHGQPRASRSSGSSSACALRDVAVLVLMALVVRDVLRPDGDVVRTQLAGRRRPGRRRPGPGP